MFNFINTISHIKPFIFKYKGQFYGIFLFHAVRVVLSAVVSPIFFKRIVDVISTANVDRAALTKPLMQNILFLTIFLFFGWLFGRITQFAMAKFQSKVIRDLHNYSFKKLHEHSYTFFADNFAGALVNKSRKFVRAFEVMHDIVIDNFWNSFILFIAIFVVFFLHSPIISLIFLSMFVIYMLILIVMSKKQVGYNLAEAAADSRVTAHLADSITNVLPIKSSSAMRMEVENFQKVTKEEEVLRLKAWTFSNKVNAIQSGISTSIQILITITTAYLWLSGKISAGMFVLVQSYSVTIGSQFWDLGRASTRFTKALSDMREMVTIFSLTPDVLDTSSPIDSKIKEGTIEIENIYFNYRGGINVFENFSLKVNPGEKVGIVGHSGSGKSTITKLLMRFIDVSAGKILIDGQNIKDLTQDDLRKNISYISQEPILFHRSIRENIAYSKPGATEEEIIEVARKAHAHEFIMNLKSGYNTLVGERGVKLSGGERQRIAIARAMLKNSPILILDEATSSLDSISESYIQDSFDELMKGKTTLVIAHRLSTIQKMDRIVVLDKGKIVEEGTHQELLAKGGLYADLWDHQTGGFLE